jgi:hypothetical protein
MEFSELALCMGYRPAEAGLEGKMAQGQGKIRRF